MGFRFEFDPENKILLCRPEGRLANEDVIELYDRTLTRDKLHRVLQENRDRNGWLIFYAHDVAETPSGIACRPSIAKRGKLALCRRPIAAIPMTTLSVSRISDTAPEARVRYQ